MKSLFFITFGLILILCIDIVIVFYIIKKIEKDNIDIHDTLSGHKEALLKVSEKLNSETKSNTESIKSTSIVLQNFEKEYLSYKDMISYKSRQDKEKFEQLCNQVKLSISEIEKIKNDITKLNNTKK